MVPINCSVRDHTFEESVKEERNNGNNKPAKERKTRVVKPNVDVTIFKDAKSFINKMITY